MMDLDEIGSTYSGSSSSVDIKCCFCPAFSFPFFLLLRVATLKLRLFKFSGLGRWLDWDGGCIVLTDPQRHWNEENKWAFSKLEVMITRRYVSSSSALGSVGWGSTSSLLTQPYFMIKIGYSSTFFCEWVRCQLIPVFPVRFCKWMHKPRTGRIVSVKGSEIPTRSAFSDTGKYCPYLSNRSPPLPNSSLEVPRTGRIGISVESVMLFSWAGLVVVSCLVLVCLGFAKESSRRKRPFWRQGISIY